jgi:site-specific recombinase XerD
VTDDLQLFRPQSGAPVRSYAEANRELVEAFIRWMKARVLARPTIREYTRTAKWFTEYLGSASVAEADRPEVLGCLETMTQRGVSPNRLAVDTAALRCFFKFLQYAEVIRINPMLRIAHRKLPHRLPRVLTIEEVEKLIKAARNPWEKACVETLYATGVRVSELCNIRLQNIDFRSHTILIKKGKGRKDRYVLFGEHAAKAIAEYVRWRPSKEFLFEAPARVGNTWKGRCYVNSVQHEFSVGSVQDLGSYRAAHQRMQHLASKIPGFTPVPQRPYQTRSVGLLIRRLGHRAGLGRVYPHALRRAMACHMLKSGADMRSIQELLGHSNLTTTQLYTYLTPHELKRVHERCHPHEQTGETDAETEA